jgi:uncharacterized repeat protein (TIGR03847 family)
MSESFDLEAPDHFTAGTVGPPGQRVFYMQGREAGLLVTLKVEKEQVRALADYLAGLLARLPAGSGAAAADVDLIEPVEPAWVVASLGVGYDEDSDRVVIVANELSEPEDEEGEGETETEAEVESAEPPELEAGAEAAEDPDAAVARFRVTRGQAAAFVERTRNLVKAGRPLCPICNRPIDPDGHVCVRSNGHVAH